MPPVWPDSGGPQCSLAPRYLDPLPVMMGPLGGAPQPNARHDLCSILCPSGNKDGSGKLSMDPPSPGHTTLPCGCGHTPRWHSIQQHLQLQGQEPNLPLVRAPCVQCAFCFRGQSWENAQSQSVSHLLVPLFSFYLVPTISQGPKRPDFPPHIHHALHLSLQPLGEALMEHRSTFGPHRGNFISWINQAVLLKAREIRGTSKSSFKVTLGLQSHFPVE